MNKEERAFLGISLSLQTRTISLYNVMNWKSIGAVTTKRTHGVGAVTKNFPIQRVAGDASDHTACPVSQVTMRDAHLSCVYPGSAGVSGAGAPSLAGEFCTAVDT